VPIYYLEDNPNAQPDQFTSTYYIAYVNKQKQVITGPAGFTAAVQGGYFQVIAYNDDVTIAADGALAAALKKSPDYRLAKVVHLNDSFGEVNYYIWVKKAPASHDKKAHTSAIHHGRHVGHVGHAVPT
jgi:hypothetical protein